ncbi:MAG: DUF2058 family protein [bacterium]
MADLRDQLLRAGLIDKQSKQQADTTDRRNKKTKKKKKKKGSAPSDEERRRQAYEERLATEAEENRRRAREKLHLQQERERQQQVSNLAGAWAVRERKPGPRRFCFVTRERRIVWFDLSVSLALQLEVGAMAIVERPGDSDEPYAIVPRAIAERVSHIDPQYVLFWSRST